MYIFSVLKINFEYFKGAVQLDSRINRFLDNEVTSKSISGKALHFQPSSDKTIPCSTFAILDKQVFIFNKVNKILLRIRKEAKQLF